MENNTQVTLFGENSAILVKKEKAGRNNLKEIIRESINGLDIQEAKRILEAICYLDENGVINGDAFEDYHDTMIHDYYSDWCDGMKSALNKTIVE